MADTIRELILQDVQTQLEKLSGYGDVRRDPDVLIRDVSKGDDTALPCMLMIPGKDAAEKAYGQQQLTMPVSIYAIQVIGDNVSGPLAEVILGELINNLIGGRGNISRIDDLQYVSGGVEDWPDQADQALSVQIDIEIQYSTNIGDPYSQTSI
jgi:hypothetical protein